MCFLFPFSAPVSRPSWKQQLLPPSFLSLYPTPLYRDLPQFDVIVCMDFFMPSLPLCSAVSFFQAGSADTAGLALTGWGTLCLSDCM